MRENEIIRPVKDYENEYLVSSLGYIMSLPRKHTRGKVIKPIIVKDYCRVHLSKNGHGKCIFVHTIVAQAFPEICGEWFEGAEISHLDENPLNNRAENLRYVSHTENINHGSRTDKVKETFKRKGISKKIVKLDNSHNIVDTFNSMADAEKEGFNHSGISRSCYNNNLKYKGFYWQFV